MKSNSLKFLAICLVFATAYGDLVPRIIGGNNATNGQFPYQASLRNKSNNEHLCGASIISSSFLLTAAHCTAQVNSNPSRMVAVVGALRLSEDGVLVKIAQITPHEEWIPRDHKNDISLIRTIKEIVFTDNVQPIALPLQELPEKDTTVLLTGWGAVKYNPVINTDILQYAESRTIDNLDCNKRLMQHGLWFLVFDSTLCTINEGDVGPCVGDSGGPLVDITDPAKKTLAGITSWGVTCGKGYPNMYTRVHYYLDWIQKNIEDQS